ncbi:ABC transporter permease [Streptomyces sp. NPDC091217]|uniref:ABC transporter permease n=1 Tax=Streptomyces sp. NPDC091217 TaxID=3365975 RepID=UPI0038284BD3
MSRLGAVRAASGRMSRHRVSSIVVCVVLLASTASAVLGLALLAAVDAPFRRAFAAHDGADVTVTVDTSHAGGDRLAATGALAGVTAVSGPYPEATVRITFGGLALGPRVLAARPSPGGPVDEVTLSAGHWPTGPGQVVLYSGDAGPGEVGDRATVTGVPGVGSLTVVGFASSVTGTADGWVAPAEVNRLRGGSAPPTAQLLYRFADAGTDARVAADIAEIKRALPAGAVTGAVSWLDRERKAAGNSAVMQPFVVAFALICLAMAVLVVANVISAAVVAQYRRIGVLKSIGFTPEQVAASYLLRIGAPALAGCVAGAVLGNLAAIPVLDHASGIYGVGRPHAPLWTSAVATAGMLALTMLAALGPALRAGRLPAVRAITAGRAPRPGRGYLVHRIATRLPLPRPVGIGLAAPFTRPARGAVTVAAIAFGATAVMFAAGLTSALGRVEQAQTLSRTVPVQLRPVDGHVVPSAVQDAQAVSALRARPGTERFTAVYGGDTATAVGVRGIARPVTAEIFGTDASWLGYSMVAGHWYGMPGQVVVNSAFLTDSGLAVGDSTTVSLYGAGTSATTVRIVGEVFAPHETPWLYTGAQTLPRLATRLHLQGYDVALKPGTDPGAYARAVNSRLGNGSRWAAVMPQGSGFYAVATSLITLLAAMVTVGASLGVLNTVLMSTRERVHDLGVFKALGMRPGQTLAMVVSQTAVPALVAAVIAAPAAIALTDITVGAMADAAHSGVPADFTQVFPLTRLAVLSLGALAVALVGALPPAVWAARARPVTALRTE